MIYIPAAWEDRVREWVERHGEIRRVLDQLSLASIQRLQSRQE